MSKYDPLSARLADQAGGQWRASFAEIEAVLGFPLPKAARSGGAWWSGDKPHARAWITPGWEVGEVDPAGGAVTFRKAVDEAAMQNAPATVVRHGGRWGGAAAIAAGLAITAGVGALMVRGIFRRRA